MYHSKVTKLNHKDQVPFITFDRLSAISCIRHGFSTRLGGVSQGIYTSMNLSFTRGDDPEAVKENFKRIGAAMGLNPEKMVMSDQTHTTNVRVMTMDDAGKGIFKDKDYSDVDGMVTNVPGLVLVTSYADCVPLYFVDPVKKVIGLSHSGWRGTVGHMGRETIKMMHDHFGCDAKDIIAAIGPSICQSCYEVSEDVAQAFKASFTEEEAEDMMIDKGHGKYQLDLWKANAYVLKGAGILPENLIITDICTRCNSDLLWSHRATSGQRGGLCAFLSLQGE